MRLKKKLLMSCLKTTLVNNSVARLLWEQGVGRVIATQKKFVVGQHHESVWLRQADGETRTLTPQQMERTEGSNPSLSSQTLSTSWESICFTRRGSAIETRHHPPTCATDFESPVYTNFITLAFKVITPYGIPLKYY